MTHLWKEPYFPAFVSFCVTFAGNLRKPSRGNCPPFTGEKRWRDATHSAEPDLSAVPAGDPAPFFFPGDSGTLPHMCVAAGREAPIAPFQNTIPLLWF